jgi:hypothetical protein
MLTYFALVQWFLHTIPKLWFRRPPNKPKTATPNMTPAQRCKKLLLLALLVGLRKAQSIPHVSSVSESHFRRQVCLATRGRGNNAKLMMAKLETQDRDNVLRALQSLPDTLFDQGDLKSSISDTGASFHASGYESDFVPGTLKELHTPFKLDGIAGSLTATKMGTMHHTVLSDSGTEETLEMVGVFMPGLET